VRRKKSVAAAKTISVQRTKLEVDAVLSEANGEGRDPL
jgi:hypothetical protein